MPKVLKKIHAWLHEDMQQVELGGMLGLRNVTFISSFPSPFLTFHGPNKPFIIPFPYIHLGFTLLFSTLFILVL
jgi:hypothetical protein